MICGTQASRGSSLDGKGEDGIDRDFEGARTPLHLGEKQSPLEGGEHGGGEVVQVNAGCELPLGVKRPESFADGG
jgi:hypothetical protein